jgi:hypothetical protein
MRLTIHNNALRLSEIKAHSRAGGHMFMAGTKDIPINNRVVLNILQIIRAVMSLAAEAELGTLFINAKMVVSMPYTLKELGHPQTRTPIQTDNSTAHTLLTKNYDQGFAGHGMQFHWLHCHKMQDVYCFYWRPGTQNLAYN